MTFNVRKALIVSVAAASLTFGGTAVATAAENTTQTSQTGDAKPANGADQDKKGSSGNSFAGSSSNGGDKDEDGEKKITPDKVKKYIEMVGKAIQMLSDFLDKILKH